VRKGPRDTHAQLAVRVDRRRGIRVRQRISLAHRLGSRPPRPRATLASEQRAASAEVRVCASARACVHACVRPCVRVRVCTRSRSTAKSSRAASERTNEIEGVRVRERERGEKAGSQVGSGQADRHHHQHHHHQHHHGYQSLYIGDQRQQGSEWSAPSFPIPSPSSPTQSSTPRISRDTVQLKASLPVRPMPEWLALITPRLSVRE
jgi:hypothetical protein